MQAVEPREWPDKFVYVCSATRSAVVNIAPIAHAGRHRISHVVIFCGAVEGSDSEADTGEAIEPGRQLKEWLESQQIHVRIIYGSAEDAGHWARALRSCATAASSEGLPVVFNAAGGRAQMKIGALWSPLPNVRTLVTEGAPLRSGFIDSVDDQPTYLPAIRHGAISLGDYLYCYGAVEVRGDRRVDVEEFFSRHETAIESFGNALLAGREQKLAHILNSRAQNFFQGDVFEAGDIVLPTRSTSLSALRCLTGLPGLLFSEPQGEDVTIRVSDARTAKLLCGVWLEGLLFNRLRKFTAGGHALVVASLCFSDRIRRKDREAWGEADVALMINDQLHVIEAKAAAFRGQVGRDREAGGARRKALDQVNLFKRRLLGPFGKMWVVNPLASYGDVTPGYRSRIRPARLLLGVNAIEDVIREIGALLQ